jgi:PBP1b-binding outer membrane lipoprotein LpoB
MNANSKERQALRLRVATVLAGALIITACASTPAPTAQLQAAQQAIAAAERTDASRHAAAELGAAQAKLASANTAVHAREMDAAARLADESRVEAELAAARTASVKARMVNDEMKRSTGTLIDEMQRNTGDPK